MLYSFPMLRSFSAALPAAAALIVLTACGGGAQKTRSARGADITVAGSTALLPLVKQAAIDYQASHPGVKISVAGGGSMTGLTQAAQKGVDIGNSDIPPAGQPELVDHRIAVVAFAVVVNPRVNVKRLTSAQIRAIFTGKIANWNQVGGANQPITTINRPRSSGTRAVFVQKIMGGAQPSENGLTQDSSGTVAAMIAQTPGAVSYLARGYVKPGQQVAVPIDGVGATDANVKSGKYTFWSDEHMVTNGQPSAAVADFIEFVKSDASLLRALHFIPVSAMRHS